MKSAVTFAIVAYALFSHSVFAQDSGDTLPPLLGNAAPATFSKMWEGFDPRTESLETEVVKEWEKDGTIVQIVRFRIGKFKGKVAKLAAVYGYPKSLQKGQRVPGLLQIHGGGQFADERAVIANANRGYATLSIAWAGRISAKDYTVNSDVVKLFWEQKTDDPRYRLTTDWGNLDGYHAPTRNPDSSFPSAKPHPWTIDDVESPRNSPWFLCALAARRGLTFLEQQSQVDGDRLGVYGHSMGGKLTVLTASDSRIKAAVPSCGGISDRDNQSELFRATVGDDPSLKQITCPILFLSPANDFHGRIGDLPNAVKEICSRDWRVVCNPHYSHRDTAPFLATGPLWFDQYLKGDFAMPATPKTKLTLKTSDGIPVLQVTPDGSKKIRSVEIYYTQQGKTPEPSSERENTKSRFWHFADPEKNPQGVWSAKLPLASAEKPLWVYANVEYELKKPVSGAGYYYESFTANTFKISSLLNKVNSDELKSNGVKATLAPTPLIEDFGPKWAAQWYHPRPGKWPMATHKIHDQTYAAPNKNQVALSFEVKSSKPNTLLVKLDKSHAEVELAGGPDWQMVRLSPADFMDSQHDPLKDFSKLKTLSFLDQDRLPGKQRTKSRVVGQAWTGDPPTFRDLRWSVGKEKAKVAVQKFPTVKTERTQEVDNAILDVFPASTVNANPDQQGKSIFHDKFTPSKSLWAQGLDESKVFQGEMIHTQNEKRNFSLRMGKGGQIYSLRGSFGESVPPSWRQKGSHSSPWNDEVWQFVAVCTKYNGLDHAKKAGPLPKKVEDRIKKSGYKDGFFVHNSGAYIPGDEDFASLYCPLLSSQVDPEARCFRMLNWGLVPQVKSISRSPILYYTQVRDAGNGVIEMTWVVHNFSVREDIVFNHLNAPWGGTRISSLPFRYVSAPNGSLLQREEILNESGVVDVAKTAGWNLSCGSEDADSPSLALVYGLDKHLDSEKTKRANGEPYVQTTHSLYRDWRARHPAYLKEWKDWRTRPANSFRNYDVCEVIPKLEIRPNTTIWYRSYLVVGPKDKVMQQADRLVDQVDYGQLNFQAKSSPKLHVRVGDESVSVSLKRQQSADQLKRKHFQIYGTPVAGTKPLFLIEHAQTHQKIITTDPYYFVPQEKLNLKFPPEHPFATYYNSAVGYSLSARKSRWDGLMGFGAEEKPTAGNWTLLSSLLDEKTFPPVNQFHLDLWVESSND